MTREERIAEIESNFRSHKGTVFDLGDGTKASGFYLNQVFDDYEYLIKEVKRLSNPDREAAIKKLIEAVEYYANQIEPELKENYESALALMSDLSHKERIAKILLPAKKALDAWKKVNND
jgi:hypothetical protein